MLSSSDLFIIHCSVMFCIVMLSQTFLSHSCHIMLSFSQDSTSSLGKL